MSITRPPMGRTAIAVGSFFATKVAVGLVMLAASARWLPVSGFAIFTQLSVLLAYFSILATAGVQNGLIRQVAAADADHHGIEREVRASLIIWLCVAVPLALVAWLLREPIAILLAGAPHIGWAIPWVALVAIVAGLGQLLCSILTGRGQVIFALSAQAVGLMTGAVPALLLLREGEPSGAALAFTGGQIMTVMLAAWRNRTILRGAWHAGSSVKPEIMRLFGFSGAFLATASIMPLTLMTLRSIYRTSFGLDALGYWLAANRISDVNTQLLGLYMTQAFLPAMAREPAAGQKRLALVTAAGAASVMVIPFAAFLLFPTFLVRTFLSAKFLPATGFMTGYFAGDVLRVVASTASYTALARGRLVLYVGIEATSAILISLFLVTLTWSGWFAAPPIAYVGAYGSIALAALLFFLRRRAVATAPDRP